MTIRRLGTATVLLLMTACSSHQYKDYVGDIDDPALEILDLSEGAADAPVIYFDTLQYREVGIPFHRLFLATRADGKLLPDAGKKSIMDYSGYQALRMTPGEHSLEWCWVSMNKLGTGGGKCGFVVPSLHLEAGKRYLATWVATTNITGVRGREQMEITVESYVIDRNTREQILPKKGTM